MVSRKRVRGVRVGFLVISFGCATQSESVAASAQDHDCPSGGGETYQVGPQQRMRRLSDVPWDNLGAGDRVLVYWRPEPYREQILISAQGTAEKPVRICGIPGPGGQSPVITGQNARNARALGFSYAPTQERGVVVLSLRIGEKWGSKPRYVVLSGLSLRGASPDYSFTDQEGKTRHYSKSAAALFIERGEHIVVRRCVLTDSANGLFVASGDSEEVMSRDILIEGNHIYGNGIADSMYQHNAYTEAIGMVYQFNRFGTLRSGAGGNALKDRSAGTIIRYNWIEGGAHLLDLVDPEDSAKIASADPEFHKTYVYGNILFNGPFDGGNLVHYGGDSGNTAAYRKGILFFFNNTVVIRGEERTRWNTAVFRLETRDEQADVRNNIVFREGSTHLFLSDGPGGLRLGTNWVSQGFGKRVHAESDGAGIEGLDRIIQGRGSPFVNIDGLDLRVRPGSEAARTGDALGSFVTEPYWPRQVYVPHQRARAAPERRAVLGALE
jgi:hypothetical protein